MNTSNICHSDYLPIFGEGNGISFGSKGFDKDKTNCTEYECLVINGYN